MEALRPYTRADHLAGTPMPTLPIARGGNSRFDAIRGGAPALHIYGLFTRRLAHLYRSFLMIRSSEGVDHDGPSISCFDDRILSTFGRLRARLREVAVGEIMNLESILGLVVSVLLLIYLGYALLWPERF